MPDRSVVDEMKSTSGRLAVCWTGNTGWLLWTEGRLIGIDLDLEYPGIKLAEPPVTAEELAPHLDLAFVTHEHGDHFNDPTCQVLAEQSECAFVVPYNCVDKAERLGIPQGRMTVATPREPFDLDGGPIEPIRAYHGHQDAAIYAGANEFDCGYVVALGGMRVLFPGDSVLLQDQMDLEGIDVLFISPTVHNTHIDRSVTLIRTLAPAHIFPQHFGTYQITPENDFWTHGYPDDLAAALPDDLRAGYHKLEQGQVFVIE